MTATALAQTIAANTGGLRVSPLVPAIAAEAAGASRRGGVRRGRHRARRWPVRAIRRPDGPVVLQSVWRDFPGGAGTAAGTGGRHHRRPFPCWGGAPGGWHRHRRAVRDRPRLRPRRRRRRPRRRGGSLSKMSFPAAGSVCHGDRRARRRATWPSRRPRLAGPRSTRARRWSRTSRSRASSTPVVERVRAAEGESAWRDGSTRRFAARAGRTRRSGTSSSIRF